MARATSEPRRCARATGKLIYVFSPRNIVNLDNILIDYLRQCMSFYIRRQTFEPPATPILSTYPDPIDAIAPSSYTVSSIALSAGTCAVLLEDEAEVVEGSPSSTQDFHVKIPLIMRIKNWLDEVGLTVCDVKKDAVIFQDPPDLFVVSSCSNRHVCTSLLYSLL